MKYKEFIEVKTLVKKGKVEARQIGTIISILENPEGYIVEFCHDTDYEPWAIETYHSSEIEPIKNS